MEELRVLVVGESLFAESLHHLLSEEEQHINVERVANFALAQPALQNKLPHVLILVDLDMSASPSAWHCGSRSRRSRRRPWHVPPARLRSGRRSPR